MNIEISTIEVIGYIALVFNLAGNWMIAYLIRWGWPARLLSNAIWIYYASQVPKGSPMWVGAVISVIINIQGWVKWSAEQKRLSGK